MNTSTLAIALCAFLGGVLVANLAFRLDDRSPDPQKHPARLISAEIMQEAFFGKHLWLPEPV